MPKRFFAIASGVVLSLVALPAAAETIDVDGRPLHVHVPSGAAGRASPVVILLHGYSVDSTMQDAYFGLGAISDEQGFVYAYPDGTRDLTGNQFWRASHACCQFFGGTEVDDLAYVDHIIEAIAARWVIQRSRIFVVGHSNGAFMAHKVGCENAKVAAIVSLAGGVPTSGRVGEGGTPTACSATSVSVLQIHGTHDAIVDYEGHLSATIPWPSAPSIQHPGYSGPPPAPTPDPPPPVHVSFPASFVPSADVTVRSWASHDGCTGARVDYGHISLDRTIPGDETTLSHFEKCPTGIDVELWTISGGSHIPDLDPGAFSRRIYAWLYAHPKRPSLPPSPPTQIDPHNVPPPVHK